MTAITRMTTSITGMMIPTSAPVLRPCDVAAVFPDPKYGVKRKRRILSVHCFALEVAGSALNHATV